MLQIDNTLIENLSLGGAGAAGVAYGRLFAALAKVPGFSFANIKRLAGTSVGAIAALIIALNYTPEEANSILDKLDLKKLADGGCLTSEMFRLFIEYGIYDGEEVARLILGIIQNKTNRRDADQVTFRDLKEMGFKDLYVVATKMYKKSEKPIGKQKIFSFETTPDTSVAAAVRASAAAPLYFAGIRLKKEAKGKYVIDNDGDWFSDGGLVNNNPINIFDDPKYSNLTNTEVDSAKISEIINPHTLAIALCYSEQLLSSQKSVKARIPNGNFFEAMEAVVNTLMRQFEEGGLDKKKNRERTIMIDRLDVGLGDFDMSRHKREALNESVDKAVATFFNLPNAASANDSDFKNQKVSVGKMWQAKKSPANDAVPEVKKKQRSCVLI